MKVFPFRSLIAIGLFTFCAHSRVSAQDALGLHIVSLTSAERDSITRQAPMENGLRVIYACVPAGVMVFDTDQRGISGEDLRTRVVQVLRPLLGEGRVAEGTLTLQAAEEACENVRGR